jgi:hypothetical protein
MRYYANNDTSSINPFSWYFVAIRANETHNYEDYDIQPPSTFSNVAETGSSEIRIGKTGYFFNS